MGLRKQELPSQWSFSMGKLKGNYLLPAEASNGRWIQNLNEKLYDKYRLV